MWLWLLRYSLLVPSDLILPSCPLINSLSFFFWSLWRIGFFKNIPTFFAILPFSSLFINLYFWPSQILRRAMMTVRALIFEPARELPLSAIFCFFWIALSYPFFSLHLLLSFCLEYLPHEFFLYIVPFDTLLFGRIVSHSCVGIEMGFLNNHSLLITLLSVFDIY